MLPGRLQAIEATDPRRVPAGGTTTGHDLVPSRERARDHFSTDAAARKRNLEFDRRTHHIAGSRLCH